MKRIGSLNQRISDTRTWLNEPFYFTRGVALVLPLIVGLMLGALVWGGIEIFQENKEQRQDIELALKLNRQNDTEQQKILNRLTGLEHPTTEDLREYFRRLLLALRGELQKGPKGETKAEELRRTLLRVIEELGFRLTGEPPRGSGRETRPDAGIPAPSPKGGDTDGPAPGGSPPPG